MNDHEKVLRGDVPGMARAWLDVTDLLDELVPGWSNTDLLGRDAAIAAIRGLAAIGERGEPWRPIESCPNDKTVLLGIPDSCIEMGYREGKRFYIHNNGDYTDGGYGNPYPCGGVYFEVPTHWMPLPTPPTQGAASANELSNEEKGK